MFQGTPVAPKGARVRVNQGGGGLLEGSTRADFTNYIATAPVAALRLVLWLEADRMKTLDFSSTKLKNQQDGVKDEIRVNVQNQPYGLYFWIDLNRLAFSRWANAHDGVGSVNDLDRANLDDVKALHRDDHGPNDAIVGVVGDVDAQDVFGMAQEYFGAIARRETPARTDVPAGRR